LQIDERAGLLTRTPPVGERPLLWKEVYLGGQYAASQFRDVVFLIVFSATLVMFLTLMLLILPMTIGSGLSGTGRELNAVLRCLAVLNLGLLCAAVGFRAAGSISREREQRTLDGLLSLPVDRNEILGAKWLGSLLWARGFALCVVLVLAGGLFTTAFHPGAVVLLAFAGAVHALFFASLGLWLSVACRTSLRAVFLLALVLLALLLGPWVVVTFSRSLGRGSADLFVADFLEVGLNPVGAWWFLGFSWGEARDWEGSARLAAACFGLCTYAVAAGVLWLLAELRLRREGEHGG
jgi:ABC-type transport system involved in multi-copper enzyme maturation permease subunit